jgi:cytochrome c oxidase cbb3-type subunit III
MSDFTDPLWSLFVAGATLVSIAACALLLLGLSKGKAPTDPEKTGHVWDEDLDELNNPLPRWWIGLFAATIVFSLAYLWVYPGLGSFEGAWKWTSAREYADEVKVAERDAAPIYARLLKADLRQMASDPEVRAMGQKLFLNHCAQCHSSDARGSRGFPNLTDDAWLYGGEADLIEKTILDGRNGVMPALGASLGPEGTKDVANYVRSLSGQQHAADRAARGEKTFRTVCAACHGAEGKGNRVVGAPDLTDRTWEYGSSEAAIVEIVTSGRKSMMPAHRDTLGEPRVRILAAYVYSLSHPETKGVRAVTAAR